ncbi:MAG TPA: hypothetical protein VK400_09645, partial [Pyrinomonadaceae bacterium]|nr:hypothetical protein [Pyrinomonadaceae bacterium]
GLIPNAPDQSGYNGETPDSAATARKSISLSEAVRTGSGLEIYFRKVVSIFFDNSGEIFRGLSSGLPAN